MKRIRIAALTAVLVSVWSMAAWKLMPDPYPGCESYTPVSGVSLVAHAGGGLPDRTYANNLDAMNLAVEHGHTLIELDFIERGGKLLIGHDDENISDLTMAGLIRWLDRHPSVTIITDVKTGNLSGLTLLKEAAGERQSRFIPQIYQPA